MTVDESEPQDALEHNVGRLFDRVRAERATSPDARDRILQRLLQEATPARSARSGILARRWVRWAGLAAALFVAAAFLTGRRNGPATSSGGHPVTFAIHLLAAVPGQGAVEAASARDGEPVLLHSERQVSNADVASAQARKAGSGCQVDIRLTGEGTEKLARLTRDHVGERLALVIDGKVVMTPTIRSEIAGGEVVLTGDFTDARCETIARGLSPRH